MLEQMIEKLHHRVIDRFLEFHVDERRKFFRGTKITFEDWCMMHKLRNVGFRAGILTLDEFQLLNSWLGIDQNTVNNRVVTFRIVVIGTFQHISRRLYEEKVLID